MIKVIKVIKLIKLTTTNQEPLIAFFHGVTPEAL